MIVLHQFKMTSISLWLVLTSIIWTFVSIAVVSAEISSSVPTTDDGSPIRSNCYAEAVYDELIKVIDIVKANTYKENDGTVAAAPHSKKFQEEEDYGGAESPFEVPNLVPMIFQLVGSAIALNSSGLSEGSFGLLPESVSQRITTVLGSLAHTIFPGIIPTTTKKPPPRRRRRSTTTTTVASTDLTDAITEESSTIANTSDSSTIETVETKGNVTSELDTMNSTESVTEKLSTTTDVLFKEGSLGELPVYAAAYAPNYVATTAFPVYASNFLHVLYPAPTTTTVATTTTTASTTSADPNSYQIALPFDYQEGIGIGTGPIPAFPSNNGGNLTDMGIPPNATIFPPLPQQTPPEYGEYEYEEQTEEAKLARYNRNDEGSSPSHLSSDLISSTDGLQLIAEGEDDKYAGSSVNSSLGRIGNL